MLRKVKHSLLGLSLVAATVAAPAATSQLAAQGSWGGFTATSTPSGLNAGGANTSPAFTAATTHDLGGAGVDLFVSNHAERSEWLTDYLGGTATTGLFNNAIVAAGGFDSHGAAFSDIDGDGDEDLVETSGRGHDTRVFVNTGGTMVAATSHGLEDYLGRGRTVLMVDIDNDGDMDAMIANLRRSALTADGTPENDPTTAAPSELYLNDGSGAFTVVADPTEVLHDLDLRYLHVTTTGPGEAPVIISSNDFVFAQDTIQTGSATLVAAPNAVNPSVGLADNATNMRDIALGDLDGDLSPEFVAARQTDFLADPALIGALPMVMGQVSTSSLAPRVLQEVVAGNALLDNCRSVAVADYDNDADLDIFAGCSAEEDAAKINVVLLNDGAGNFTMGASSLVPATAALGTATVAINADFNDDGWVDTYVGGSFDNQGGEDSIFMNKAGANNWLKVELVGSNPDVIGAQVFVGTDKWQVRETGHRTHRGQDMKELHFGLGTETEVAPLEIMWPDGTFETCTIGAINATATVTQGSADCVAQTKTGLQAAVTTAPVTGTTTTTTTTAPPVGLVCNNLAVTVNMALGEMPTAGDDVIRGTAGNDVINGLGGNDTICSLQGDDTINGGAGFDKVFAGAGNDTINGGTGNDLLTGGAGNDTINGDTGNDRLQGGNGVDIMNGGGGLDRLAGNNGNDILRGGTHNDQMFGNLGNDQLFGDGGNDVLRGGSWVDIMNGGAGSDDGCTLADPGGRTETRINCEGGVFGR